MLDSNNRSVGLVKIKSELLRIALCNQSCLVFENSTFSITINGENPLNTNCFPARRELDKSPRLVLLNVSEFLLHYLKPLMFIGSLNCVSCGFLVGRFDGGVNDFGHV